MDIEQKMAEGKGRGYERWAKIHNLKQAAKTLSVYQQYGFTSPEQLEAAVDTAYQKMRQTSGELKALETKLQGKKKLQRQVLAYAQTKAARDGLRAQKSEKARAAYRQAHESDFIIADAAARYFKAHGITKLPARKALQAEIEQLISRKTACITLSRTETAVQGVADRQAEHRPDFAPGRAAPQKGAEP